MSKTQFLFVSVLCATFIGFVAQAQDAPNTQLSIPMSVPPNKGSLLPGAQDATLTRPLALPLPIVLPAKLNVGDLYVYSFLDVRENEFSPQVLDELDRQLTDDFMAKGVAAHILRFKASQVGMFFSQAGATSSRGGYRSSESIPVQQTIESDSSAEQMFNVRYRLIEFPADFQVAGAWRFYKVRWMLQDRATGRFVWQYTYNGRNLIWLRNGERAADRAKPLIDTLIVQLQSAGFL